MSNVMTMMAVFLLWMMFLPPSSDVTAYPQGAPEQACVDMFCHADKPPLAFSFGYTITLSSLTYSPSGQIKGTLTSKSKKHFRGFLLRAVLADSVPDSIKGKKTSWYSDFGYKAGRKRQSTLPTRIRRSLDTEELDADFFSGLSEEELAYYLSQPEIVKKIISDPALMTMLPDKVVQKVFEQNVILNPEEHSNSTDDSNSQYDSYSEEEDYPKEDSKSEVKRTLDDVLQKEKDSNPKKKTHKPSEIFTVPGSVDTRRRQNERPLREIYPNKHEPSPHKLYEPAGAETVIQNEQPARLPPKTDRNGDANRYSKSSACVKQQQLVKESWNFSPVGHFLTTSSTVKPACINGTSGGLTHTDSDKKFSISFVWKAPAELDADIVFHASVVYSKALWWNNIVSTVVTLADETSTSITTTTTLTTPSSTLVTTTVTSSTSASFTTKHTAGSTTRGNEKGDNNTLSTSKTAETSIMMVGGTSHKTSIAMASMTTQHRDTKKTANNDTEQPEQTSPVTHSATSSSIIQTRNLARSTSNRSYENDTTTESTNEMYGHITLPDWWGSDSKQLIPMQWMLCSVALMVIMAMF